MQKLKKKYKSAVQYLQEYLSRADYMCLTLTFTIKYKAVDFAVASYANAFLAWFASRQKNK